MSDLCVSLSPEHTVWKLPEAQGALWLVPLQPSANISPPCADVSLCPAWFALWTLIPAIFFDSLQVLFKIATASWPGIMLSKLDNLPLAFSGHFIVNCQIYNMVITDTDVFFPPQFFSWFFFPQAPEEKIYTFRDNLKITTHKLSTVFYSIRDYCGFVNNDRKQIKKKKKKKKQHWCISAPRSLAQVTVWADFCIFSLCLYGFPQCSLVSSDLTKRSQ